MKLKSLMIGSGVLAILAVAAFGVNQWTSAPPPAGRVGQPIMPDIDLAKAARIEILSPENKTTFNNKNGRWSVGEQEDFPINPKKFRQLILNLTGNKIAHKVTSNPDKLAKLGLLTVEENGGKAENEKTGTLLRVLDQDSQPIFELLTGIERRGQGNTTYGGTYIRYPGSSDAYLISETVMYETKPEDWIDTVVFDLDAGKMIKSIRVERKGKAPVVLTRSEPEKEWVLEGAKQTLDQSEAKSLANSLAGLDIFGIKPGDTGPATVGRKNTGTVRFQFFDQRTFIMEIGEEKAKDDFRYLTIRAEAAASVQDQALLDQVKAFNERYEGRLLAIYDWDGGRMLREREDLLEKKKDS